MLNIQKYLRETAKTNGAGFYIAPYSFEQLEKEYGVYAKQHPDYPNLIQLAYDQIEAKQKDHPIVRECRGIILDSTNDWKVVAYPFKRFANYGETWAAEIDWNTARVQEKVDGSLCILYYYADKWHVATRGSANAAGQVGDNPITFKELFWKTFTEQFTAEQYNELFITPYWPTNYTWMFELTSPMNRVVVDHKKASLTFLGCRHNISLEEFPSCYYPELHAVKEFPLTSFDACLKAAKELNPIQTEGFVVVDGNFNRVKIKSPSYVALHHIRDAWGPRRIIELIKAGETEEVLTYFPEYVEAFRKLQSAFNNLIFEHESGYESVMGELRLEKGFEFTQKDFALKAVKYTCPAALFCYRNGKVNSIKEFFLNMSEDKILELLK